MSALLAICALTSQLAGGAEPLTNEAIVEMVRAGLSGEVIVGVIRTRDQTFDLSVKGLVALKRAGVTDSVLEAMLTVAAPGSSSKRRADPAVPLPDEQGVYWLGPDGLRALPVEHITQRMVGGVRHTGVIDGPRSGVRVVTPVTFIVRAADNITADDHVLLQLYTRDDRRQFQTITKDILTASPNRMEVPFESERVAPSVHRVRVRALPKGEYGFVRPGALLTLSGSGSIGVLHSFGVD